MVKWWLKLLLLALCLPALGQCRDRENMVIVYSSLETNEIISYLEQARKDMPELNIYPVRLSTGEIGARILAERHNPQADVIWGWGVTNLETFVEKGLIEPYVPKGSEMIRDEYKHPHGYYTAMDLFVGVFVTNTREAEKHRLPVADSWQTLLNKNFKGKIIVPNPVSSGTGFFHLASLLQLLDRDYASKPISENKAWGFIEKLDKNIGQYIKSGSKPAKLAAAGEYALGTSFAYVYVNLKEKGFPVEMRFPREGAGYELEANALLKGARHKKAARRFLDWAISESAMKQYAKKKIAVTHKNVSGTGLFPPLEKIKLAPMNFKWQARNRAAILSEFSRRVGR